MEGLASHEVKVEVKLEVKVEVENLDNRVGRNRSSANSIIDSRERLSRRPKREDADPVRLTPSTSLPKREHAVPPRLMVWTSLPEGDRQHFLAPDPNPRYAVLHPIIQDLLGHMCQFVRHGEALELFHYWHDALNLYTISCPTLAAQILHEFARVSTNDPSWIERVDGFYQVLLDRGPDDAGAMQIMSWLKTLMAAAFWLAAKRVAHPEKIPTALAMVETVGHITLRELIQAESLLQIVMYSNGYRDYCSGFPW